MRIKGIAELLVGVVVLVSCAAVVAQTGAKGLNGGPSRPEGPCDIYAAAGDPCVAAHSTARSLYKGYEGPLYQVLRQADGKTRDIGVIRTTALHAGDAGGYADAAAQDAFCANTYCWISKVYDQSPKHNDLSQAPRGGFSGPAMGGSNTLPLADVAPATLHGHKIYGVLIAPGSGLRIDDPKGTAVDDQAEGQYWVINGLHFNSGCCFDYGNAEIDSRDDDNGTMENAYFGDNTGWIHGNPPGPWIMTDQENNLVGCVRTGDEKLCPHLPDIKWRFVTAMAKGEPHHWTSMGGDAQRGGLAVMFDGPRVNSSYDPMRKQGAILLGNGGDNSNSSQGTFYEGAMTAAGTFPSDATDQLVQANVVAAGYGVQRLDVAPASSSHALGLMTLRPGAAKDVTVTFTNVSAAPVKGVVLRLSKPEKQWSAVVSGSHETARTLPDAVAPGATVRATFTVTPGPKAFNGDLVASATWTGAADAAITGASSNATETERTTLKVRSAAPVVINEFRIGSGSHGNATDSFVELYNAGSVEVDLSGWTLTAHPAQQANFSAVQIPSGTTIAPRAFYLLGLSNSGLSIPANAGSVTLHVRSVAGMSVGDKVAVGNGGDAENRRIQTLGTAAAAPTALWHPLPDGLISMPPGSTNVPVQSIAGFRVGEKIALGYGAAVPYTGSGTEQYETATVTAIGKPGTQAYLAADAPAGGTNLKLTSVAEISVGDTIRLDIESVSHGIETVTIARVGSKASQTNLSADVSAGATRIRVRRADGFANGDRITIGTPQTRQDVTVTSVGSEGRDGAEIAFAPALSSKHGRDEWVVSPGTGVELEAPLRFTHAANLPFSDRGTGVTFTPATRSVHTSDEPVQALGSGITLDRPLASNHAINSVVLDGKTTSAGYQGVPQPNQWFGGPELSTESPSFGRVVTVHEGSLVLRNNAGLVVDSMNYGGLTDPWAAEGYQATSGQHEGGCFVASPEPASGFRMTAGVTAINRSAGRFPDGADTDSNCTDFLVQPATTLPTGAIAGDTTVKVMSVSGFHSGQPILVGTGAAVEPVTIKTVGTAGATTSTEGTRAGETEIPVMSVFGFEPGDAITIGSGSETESVNVASRRGFDRSMLIIAAPLQQAHSAGSQVSGTGLALTSGLSRAHAPGSPVEVNLPTPGAPNQSGPNIGASSVLR